jgi:hypothetical protein
MARNAAPPSPRTPAASAVTWRCSPTTPWRPIDGNGETERWFARTNGIDGSIQINKLNVGKYNTVVIHVCKDIDDEALVNGDAWLAMKGVFVPSYSRIATKLDEQIPHRTVDLS